MCKVKINKIKIMIACVLCCMAVVMPVMAFSRSDSYAIGPNETKTIADYVAGTSTVYINTRPSSGGDLTVTLSGAASGSSVFPYHTSRNAWKVENVNPSTRLYIKGTATSSGSAGTLSSWSN